RSRRCTPAWTCGRTTEGGPIARRSSSVSVAVPDRVLRFGVKPLVFIASLGPAAWLVWAILTGNLSANPLSDLTNETGIWALRFVCITLAITPLRRITGWNQAIKFRRMTGLFAFFYGTLHF